MKQNDEGKIPQNEMIARLKLVHYIAVQMNRTHSAKELLEMILGRCLELTNANTGSVIMINEADKALDIVAYKGIKEKVASKTRLKIGEGVTGWVAQSGNPRLINNTRQDPLYVSVREDLQSELAVPIKTPEKVIGVISVDSQKPNAFTEDDLELLTMVAELAAQILQKDVMKGRLESKVNAQEILIDAFNIIEREENLNDVIEKIMEVLKEKMKIDRGMLVLFDSENPDSLKIYSGYRISDEQMKNGIYKIGEGIIGMAVQKGQTIAVEDISKEPKFLNRLHIQRPSKTSIIAAPVKASQRVLGVITVEKTFSENEYFEDGVNTVTLLSSLIAYRVRSFQRQQAETQQLITENIELRKELKKEFAFTNIIGNNDKIRRIIEQIKTVSNTTATILVTGETGTGKELVAKIAHFLSDRREKKFVSVNCAAIPENLLESELFGYEKGAFTGAVASKKGKFELADGGTLFLDEIGDMPMPLQSKILRALQEKEIEPLGGVKTIKVDLRIIAATNRDLKARVDDGKFRADLYFRLNVVNLHMPPLRERKDDIILLANYFIKKFNETYSKQVAGMDANTEEILSSYNWPGNIRELENVIERAVIMSRGNLIDISLLPDNMNPAKKSNEGGFGIKQYIKTEMAKTAEGEIYIGVIGSVEKLLIEEMLIKTGNNKLQTARQLGINRNTLKTKMKVYGIV